MRNPDRIEPILNELKTLWLKHPDLRLGQLISLVGDNLFYLEDVELITILKNKLNNNNEIDYKILLQKYIRQVGLTEGVVYLDDSDRIENLFTDEEWIELRKLDIEGFTKYKNVNY